jgi:hypothetical protein
VLNRAALLFLGVCFALSLAADTNPPVCYIGGQRLFVGMSKSEAVVALSVCCTLSPPAGSENAKLSADMGVMAGHFIISKEKAILGTIFFVGGKVSRITRPLDEHIDPQSEDVVAFARALDRTLSLDTGGLPASAVISVRHQRMSNGEGEFVFLSFPNGRGIEIQIATLDNPLAGKRDSVSLDEVLQ